ncbi:MAG: hypothetical protein JST89_25730 [Cyanobacteria bacterium SZAS-4]|nr:hypothetical protein [Cyanobacteria bacterium SZAS-4]
MNRKVTKTRRIGQGLAELCAGLVVIVPVALTCVDLGTIALGATVNDNICRDAARAAASGPPGSPVVGSARYVSPGQPPYQRALAVVRNQTPKNLPIKVGEQIQVVETLRDVPAADVGGGIDGDVNVSTSAQIVPPFLVSAITGPNGITLNSKHVVPYTYTVPQTQ